MFKEYRVEWRHWKYSADLMKMLLFHTLQKKNSSPWRSCIFFSLSFFTYLEMNSLRLIARRAYSTVHPGSRPGVLYLERNSLNKLLIIY